MNIFNKIFCKFILLILMWNYKENYLDELINNILNIKSVSIIIPVYNTEKYLSDCLNSVVKQTLKNIEIICIDDGSTDNSTKILQLFTQYDDRFIIIHQKNMGSGFSRNKGIDISKGKFISFLDSDDMYYNNYALELLYKKAKNNKALICGGGMEKKRQIGNKTISNFTLFENEGYIKYADYQYDYDYQRFIYNKNFLRKNKLYFPRYLRYQDPPFFIKTMASAKKFYVIKNTTNIYRKNIGKKFNINQTLDMFLGLKECLDLGEKMKFYKLYKTTLNRLNMNMFILAAKTYYNNNNIRKTITNIIKSINHDIIKKNNFNFTLDIFYKNISIL